MRSVHRHASYLALNLSCPNARDGIDFAFVQASRGSGKDCAVAPDACGPDGWYERNYALARENGIKVGAYHRAFAGGGGRKRTQKDARREARVFVKAVGSVRNGDLLPALDLETPFGGLGKKEMRRWVRVWLDRVQRKLHAKPIIYTNTSSWSATGASIVRTADREQAPKNSLVIRRKSKSRWTTYVIAAGVLRTTAANSTGTATNTSRAMVIGMAPIADGGIATTGAGAKSRWSVSGPKRQGRVERACVPSVLNPLKALLRSAALILES